MINGLHKVMAGVQKSFHISSVIAFAISTPVSSKKLKQKGVKDIICVLSYSSNNRFVCAKAMNDS